MIGLSDAITRRGRQAYALLAAGAADGGGAKGGVAVEQSSAPSHDRGLLYWESIGKSPVADDRRGVCSRSVLSTTRLLGLRRRRDEKAAALGQRRGYEGGGRPCRMQP